MLRENSAGGAGVAQFAGCLPCRRARRGGGSARRGRRCRPASAGPCRTDGSWSRSRRAARAWWSGSRTRCRRCSARGPATYSGWISVFIASSILAGGAARPAPEPGPQPRPPGATGARSGPAPAAWRAPARSTRRAASSPRSGAPARRSPAPRAAARSIAWASRRTVSSASTAWPSRSGISPAGTPSASSSPALRLRDVGASAVATRSPVPARPTNVRACPPLRSASASTSRKMSAAAIPAALSPCAWVAPTATAAAFLATPASSTPTGSSETSQTTPERWNASATRCASASEREAQTRPAPDSTISRACAGPPTHATRCGPKARSSATVGGSALRRHQALGQRDDPGARPTRPGRSAPRAPRRRPFDGTARKTRSVRRELVVARAERAHVQLARELDARQVALVVRVRPSSSACSSVRHSSVVRRPARSSRTATAVPKEPAPTTVARRGCSPG